ncbi:GNAT family N-acetyltransferase [Nonomuraea sp. KC401]|uniref:GNAT family N-acetyltransferase n=1 Tax=unclassified Nonomuraea TaxID=2593643 RepID=UPI0010FEB9D8|nr:MULTISPECIES: GNAT family N-acetyltransferase [unclassified Nonomuraea]NBE93029.1 GNAT family N-acetyltransferase [Nonomuraea sp. K271]TLF78153.1 GNAT family N-acetyltransferase [Nonomuraea sp. KC401]
MIRPATPADVPVIATLIRELATYEKAEHEVRVTEEQLRAALFGDAPAVFAHIAEHDGEVAGFALWFLTFSTWKGVHGIYMEDLFVRPGHRGGGHGRALMGELARICAERGYERLEWAVLDWNEPAIGFYENLGAVRQEEWPHYRLSDAPLRRLADRPS